LVWFAARTGTKPSRASYPCQQAAAASSYIWLAAYVIPFFSTASKSLVKFGGKKVMIMVLASTIAGSALVWNMYQASIMVSSPVLELTLSGKLAESKPASDIFVITNTFGNDGGLKELLNLMGDHGLVFYKSRTVGKNKSPMGLIARDDVVLIKVNSQWAERGGTNTDLLKALIQAIVSHPDGFIGEVIVADNGQAQYGSTGSGGSLNWSESNAEDISQSAQRVVDSFAGTYKVSTYLWDTITTRRVNESSEEDFEDGYVVNATANPRTGIRVSYPKFKTKFGTYISFKLGVWNPQTHIYDSDKLKVINVPVLKSHSTYGVTACVKHYMGVTSDKLTAQLGLRSHSTIGSGGMGTEMVETRFPTLNIVDAIWVNANPGRGPRTPYDTATRVNVIVAGTDPVALDYWASKHILLRIARINGQSGTASIDPDNTASVSFGNWLRLSMQEITRAGYQATVNEANMDVYVARLQK